MPITMPAGTATATAWPGVRATPPSIPCRRRDHRVDQNQGHNGQRIAEIDAEPEHAPSPSRIALQQGDEEPRQPQTRQIDTESMGWRACVGTRRVAAPDQRRSTEQTVEEGEQHQLGRYGGREAVLVHLIHGADRARRHVNRRDVGRSRPSTAALAS